MRSTSAIACILPLWSAAQSVQVQGVITIHNSAYETGQKAFVSDASVRAPHAKATTSDKDGAFVAEFTGLPMGSRVQLEVSKSGMEVVNGTEIRDLVLAGDQVVEVVMADATKLAAAKARFYNVSVKAVDDGYRLRMEALRDESVALDRRLATVNERHAASVASLNDAITVLTDARERAMTKADELAALFSRLDLDKASLTFRRAFEELQQGRIDSALVVLDKEQLNADYARAAALRTEGERAIERANVAIKQVYESHGLKANVLRLDLSYPECLSVYERMRAIQSEQPDVFGARDQAELLFNTGRTLYDLGRYDTALVVLRRAADGFEQVFGPYSERGLEIGLYTGKVLQELARFDEALSDYRHCSIIAERLATVDRVLYAAIMNDMGSTLFRKGDMDSALVCYNGAKERLEHASGADTLQWATMLLNIGWVYINRGDMTGAQRDMEQGLKLMKSMSRPDPAGVSMALYSVGVVHFYKAEYAISGPLFEEGMALHERVHGADHPFMARFKAQLAHVAMHLGEFNKAADLFQETLGMNKRIFGPAHPETGASLVNSGMMQITLGDPDRALEFLNEGVGVLVPAFGPLSQWVGAAYGYKAEAFLVKEQLDSARTYYSLSVDALAQSPGPESPAHAQALSNLGHVETRMGLLDDARQHLEKALPVQEGAYGPLHREVLRTHVRYGELLHAQGDSIGARREIITNCDKAPDYGCYCTWYELIGSDSAPEQVLYPLEKCLRHLRVSKPGVPLDAGMVEVLLGLARAQGRTDLIEEFEAK